MTLPTAPEETSDVSVLLFQDFKPSEFTFYQSDGKTVPKQALLRPH